MVGVFAFPIQEMNVRKGNSQQPPTPFLQQSRVLL